MKRKLLNLVVIMLAISGLVSETRAQTRARNGAPAASNLMASLPESDAVAQVKLKQLLSEAMPQILANNPTKLSEVNAGIDRFKERTGLDPRMFQQIALGVRFNHPAEGITKLQTVALANGSFSPAAMMAAGVPSMAA